MALRLVQARTPTSGTHVTRPDRYALPKPRSLFLSSSLLPYCSLFFPLFPLLPPFTRFYPLLPSRSSLFSAAFSSASFSTTNFSAFFSSASPPLLLRFTVLSPRPRVTDRRESVENNCPPLGPRCQVCQRNASESLSGLNLVKVRKSDRTGPRIRRKCFRSICKGPTSRWNYGTPFVARTTRTAPITLLDVGKFGNARRTIGGFVQVEKAMPRSRYESRLLTGICRPRGHFSQFPAAALPRKA